MTPADHPPSCRRCAGSGYQRGADVDITVDGHTLRRYTTVEPCTHHWANDDPQPDELISRRDYLAGLAPDDPERSLWDRLDHGWLTS